jgi:hypothetical protein
VFTGEYSEKEGGHICRVEVIEDRCRPYEWYESEERAQRWRHGG